MIAQASIFDRRDRVRPQERSASGRGGRRRCHAGGSRRPTPRLAIVVQGGTVQGVYADRCGLTVHLFDYDDLRADDDLAEHVGRTGELPQVTVEAGLARVVAKYRAAAHRPGAAAAGRGGRTMCRLAIRWERDLEPVGPADRPEGHLLGTLLIGGIPHHAEAFEVEERDGCQESVLAERDTSFAELSEIVQGPMQTVALGGRPYVLLVTPFQE
jgi:hypothetical protein